MPKFKPKRMGVKIDMTPLVDVAFLLLTFFMLTTQFRPEEVVTVELPASHSDIKLPESGIMMISLGKDGRIYISLSDQLMRRRVFGPEFELKSGIEVTKERLPELLVKARTLNPKLYTVIKGDQSAEFGVAEDVMDILQKTKITRFNLVTDFERPVQ